MISQFKIANYKADAYSKKDTCTIDLSHLDISSIHTV